MGKTCVVVEAKLSNLSVTVEVAAVGSQHKAAAVAAAITSSHAE
jgi:hypothetical protein